MIRQGQAQRQFRNGHSGAKAEAAVVGKFLLGMVSGGLLVTGGLVVGSALFPTRPANDNSNAVVEEPIATPAAAATDAGAEAEEPPAQANAVPEEIAAADEPAPAEPVAAPTEAPAVEEEVAETPAEPVPAEPAPAEPAPEVATAVAEPAVPEPAAPAEAVAPVPAEVPTPETLSEPSKPIDADVDAAAVVPSTPAETEVAEAEPEPAMPEPVVEPAPAEPATATEVTAAEAAPATEAEPAEPTAEPTAEPAATDTSETAIAPAAVPTAEPAAPDEIVVAETSPETELPVADAPATEAPAPEPAPESAPEPVPEAPTAEADPGEPAPVEDPPPEASAPPAEPDTAETDAGPDAAAPAMPGARPDALTDAQDPSSSTEEKGSTFKPAPGLPRAGESAIIGRDEAAEPAPTDPAADPGADPTADPAAAPVDARPLARFAAAFENAEGKPPFAIVLIDDGSAELDRASLAALPFPVSFALNPLDPASVQHAATYRAAGKEVVMLVTGIAEGAMPADVEVAFQSMEQGLPEAVAVMDLPVPSFQNRRPLAATVVPILKAQGRGLLTWDAGLNAADQVARREDLEAAVIFRDIGSTGADTAAIRRLLDRAVFKAGQEGRVSVVGTADPTTVAALLEWTVEGKAATVALAPVTAVLTVE